MNWGRVTYIFFALMSATTIAGFIYERHELLLFIAASINAVSTLLKVGVRNMLSAELFASSLVADLHLIPAFVLMIVHPGDLSVITALCIGALIAVIFSLVLITVESAKSKDEF
ncbi:DUF6394 family protein [Campylobacter sp. JMF_01 NE2]|uniref:DUF6394 family protein n=1 Tax=unclassified Campylobacter TaxID=2593542 RepID=UPI001B710393|nr:MULTISPECIES: DUF6394 family protein [unclassified Campylobacter]MBP3224926.1 hypothetical protein [Campylobacter sp.]MDA3042771.1 DUF6394 family protein [Campylobacter sp. JMF_09 ED2]MDA3044394.1 DUF6394 family protein [Campylobacter sp. JMF_07 ED4]MDA3046920.1 DUF6394 family protein [Campylobacter sp. VBCF_06 NA8]MDA3048423.1 DUF6394 family protein [Campylobacter sp. JMF_08 NE1]